MVFAHTIPKTQKLSGRSTRPHCPYSHRRCGRGLPRMVAGAETKRTSPIRREGEHIFRALLRLERVCRRAETRRHTANSRCPAILRLKSKKLRARNKMTPSRARRHTRGHGKGSDLAGAVAELQRGLNRDPWRRNLACIARRSIIRRSIVPRSLVPRSLERRSRGHFVNRSY